MFKTKPSINKQRVKILLSRLKRIPVNIKNISIKLYHSSSAWASVFSVLLLFGTLLTLNIINGLPKKEGPVVLSVTSNADVENITNPSQPNTAESFDIVKWQKNIDFTDPDTESKTEIIENIPDNQEYQSGSLDLPIGWVASYSTLTNPTENDFTEIEPVPASSVKTIKLSYKTVTTHKPVSQTALTKPLDQEEITAPPGMTNPKILGSQEHNNKLFVIYKSVDLADGTNDTAEMTINCFDLITFDMCDGSSQGVTFPAYLSSAAGTKLGTGIKDIITPSVAKLGYDSASGRMFVPTNQFISGSPNENSGISCIDLDVLENCGFISIDTSPDPNTATGVNPTRINGFAQSGNKLYGHTNPYSDNGIHTDDLVEVFCIDMTLVARCSDYSSDVQTQIPSLLTDEHSNEFSTPGQNLLVGDQYFFLMNYELGNTRTNTISGAPYSQAFFGNRLVCFDIVQKIPCSGWSSGNVEYFYNIFTGARLQRVYGSQLTSLPSNALLNEIVSPASLFAWKDTDGSDKAICILSGLAVGADPDTTCKNFNNGANYSGSPAFPPDILPLQWLSVPWSPGSASVSNEQGGKNRFYQSYYLSSDNFLLPGNPKSAVICYDWELQARCPEFRYPHYWYEVQESNALDASYVPDGKCMIGVSGYDFAWSFDANTGESPCRHVQKTVTITPQSDLSDAYCDGQPRSSGWGKLKLDKSSLYDYRSFIVTVKDKNGNVVGSFNNVDLKTEPDGHLDISSIALSGNTDELIVDIEAELANTAPWGDDPDTVTVDANVPYLTVEMSGDPAQYCYETSVPDLTTYCDIDSVSTSTEISAELEFDTLEANNQSDMPVTIDPQTQCKKDLKISVSADKTTAKPGDLVSYTVQVENQANISPLQRGNIPGADVEATIPSGTTLYNSAGGSVVGGKVVWSGESFNEKQSKSKTVTVQVNSPTAQISPVTSFASVFGAKAYAQSQQVIAFSAQVVYAEDVNQADNSVAFNNVAVVPETPTEETPTEETPTEETPTEETPTEETPTEETPTEETPTEENQQNNQGGFTGTPENTSPPAPAPSFTQRIANTVEQSVKTIVQPIPEAVAKPLPYLFITILIILALIFAYEAYREVGLRTRLDNVNEKYHHTEELRSSYLQLISHYLNTPLAIMKSTLELIQGEHKVSEKTTNKIKEVLDNLTIHVSGLIDETKLIMDSTQSDSAISASIKNKRFMTWVIVPISATFTLVLLLNAMFIVGDKYDPTAFNFLFQLLFYGLSAVALVFAYTSYKRQKFATIASTNELNYEETLIKSQQVFIHNASATLENDALELKYAAEPIMGDPKGAVFSKGLGSINETAARLNYINEVTNFAGTKILEESTIRQITDEVIKSYQKSLENKKINFTSKIDKGVQAKVDEQGFKQLVNSSLNNAIKFGKEAGRVDLNIRKVASGTKIVVSDDGIGIPKDKLDSLFTPFGRGTDVLNYDYEGIGLDLYTNKLIAEHNGGSIDIQSKEGNGTKVTITLPSKL
jgi:uncharacterized repeat protein (TIGR01451 family)